MTNPTPLSPAAQAVLNAFGNSLTTEQYATTGRIEIAIAAALRAAALYCKQDRLRLLVIAEELDGL